MLVGDGYAQSISIAGDWWWRPVVVVTVRGGRGSGLGGVGMKSWLP